MQPTPSPRCTTFSSQFQSVIPALKWRKRSRWSQRLQWGQVSMMSMSILCWAFVCFQFTTRSSSTAHLNRNHCLIKIRWIGWGVYPLQLILQFKRSPSVIICWWRIRAAKASPARYIFLGRMSSLKSSAETCVDSFAKKFNSFLGKRRSTIEKI